MGGWPPGGCSSGGGWAAAGRAQALARASARIDFGKNHCALRFIVDSPRIAFPLFYPE
jgi:hypothetical protein